jgi:hypothetical protein
MLSKQQIEQRDKFKTHFHIWERDLLECARRWPEWRDKAHELGFIDAKIDSPWEFEDEGRLIQYMRIPD